MPARLLLVEDEAPVQELLAEYLRGRGFLVATCGDGACARAALVGGGFDLLITDLKLPDVEGVELVRLAYTREPPMNSVVISGYASVENAVAALTAGAIEVLPKPFRLREAHAAVERALAAAEQRRWTERRIAVAEWMEGAARASGYADVQPLLVGLTRLLKLHAPETPVDIREVDPDLPPPEGRWSPLGRRHCLVVGTMDPSFAPWLSAAHEAMLRCGL